MKGRKPKLFAVSEAKGNTGHRKARTMPSIAGEFDPPFELGAIGASEWRRIRAEAPWISAASAGALWLRCSAFEDLMQARIDIENRGRLIETRNGSVKNPSMQVEREARAFVMRADIEMGLTPCSQQKMPAPAVAGVDPMETALCG